MLSNAFFEISRSALTGVLLASDNYADASLIPTNGIYSKGTISTASHGTSADWNAKVRCQEIPGATDIFGLGVQNEAGHRLTEFCQERALVIENTICQQPKR